MKIRALKPHHKSGEGSGKELQHSTQYIIITANVLNVALIDNYISAGGLGLPRPKTPWQVYNPCHTNQPPTNATTSPLMRLAH